MSKFLQCAVLIAASFFVTWSACSAEDVFAGSVGQHGFMASDWYICPSWDVFKKFEKLFKEPDAVEGAQAALVLADRDCIKVRDQTEVIVEDTGYWWGPFAICVRPVGTPDCGWVLPGAVTTARCKPYASQNPNMSCVPRKEPDNPQRPWSFGYSGK
jgi:hypothetical protein